MKLVSPENAYLDLTFQGNLFGKPDGNAEDKKYYSQLITVRLNGDVSEWRGTIGVETNHLLVTKNGLPNGTVAMGLTGFPYDQLGSFENGNNGTLSVTNDGTVVFGGLALNGGRLELAAQTVCTVGDLSLRKGVIQCAATRESVGRIVVSNAISAEEFGRLPTRVLPLSAETIVQNTHVAAGGDSSLVPRFAATMGMAPILASKKTLLLACFAEQQKPLRDIIARGTPTPLLPASYLWRHPDYHLIYTADKITL